MPKLNTNAPVLNEKQRDVAQLAWVDGFGRLLDTRFRIPGTNVRFGLDFLLGLFPYAGDLISLIFSGLMVATMARNGASGVLVARMLGNVALDALVGTVPILGDLFDLFYKANIRNLQLMREHYGEGRHQGSAWPVVIGIGIFILLVFGLVAWLAWQLLSWTWGLIFS
ncbi:DUF4112 domain-containing protein [Flavilitoribacter nigricans]|uniref:DUF4112 domain-containing protein n=1 Tax=Flavilitoribacter nigricans (strain ATCC 23147 / DSM 23189 / NBRC 102662 / NCIMB 1420 / SS-2) TaxID=1122177 RepID=A0A2D0N612_FLAN2|nr:DUF4112 domain-containing protein [Flavilitoribacter nigricans]PHN03941.1 hypothetical protein CRP01_24020 [Flavilitoribacter nigricans DSM 23189 = NBRC 102662]